MKRREFITLLGGAGAVWPVRVATAQQAAMSRIGVVMPFKESDPVGQSLVAAFQQELQKLGWTPVEIPPTLLARADEVIE